MLKQRLTSNKLIFRDAAKYLRYMQKNERRIAGVKVVPPKLGSEGFGHIEVTIKSGINYTFHSGI